MRKMLLGIATLLLMVSCAKESLIKDVPVSNEKLVAKTDIDKHIRTIMDRDGIYDWTNAPDPILFSAAMYADSIFALGYQTAATDDLESTIHQIDIDSPEWLAARDGLLNLILKNEQQFNSSLTVEDLLPYGFPEDLPSMEVRITNPATIALLRASDQVRYLEAMSYYLAPDNAVERSSSGCGANPNYNLNPSDYTTIAPNTKRSWHHATSNVPSAWNNTTGQGVTVAIIDTGLSDHQDNLGSQFNSGYSNGRFVQRYSTKYSGSWWWKSLDPPHDQCGHGTQMAGLATAPRSTDGNAVGVAYNANLIGIRAVKDVFISSGNEKRGVRDALKLAGNRNDVKVISMSLGTPFSSGTVRDGIYYAYNRGKMILAAAGTSFSWSSGFGVIFPATMSQTVAVTGVKDASNMVKCNVCHSGSKVDFVMVMQRSASSSRNALTLASASDQPTYVSGSSAATASVAGIAALVYASHPGASRSQVFNAMKQQANFYPGKSNKFGWGIIDANSAVNMNF